MIRGWGGKSGVEVRRTHSDLGSIRSLSFEI